MFRHAGAARCHDLSCFACGRRIACSRSGHGAVASGRRSWHSIRVPPLSVFGMGLSFPSIFAPFSPAARLPGAAGPCLAHNARRCLRARPRAFRGGAHRAPDRPGAPARASRTQGAPRPLAESGAFSAPAPTQEEAASGCPFPSLFPVYSGDAAPNCKPFGQKFSRLPAMRLIIQEKLPRFVPRRARRGRGNARVMVRVRRGAIGGRRCPTARPPELAPGRRGRLRCGLWTRAFTFWRG